VSLEYKVGEVIDASNDSFKVKNVKQGGFGVVYLCYSLLPSPLSGRMVAIKSFQDRWFRDESIIKKFYREAETWIRLGKHRNIVEAFLVYEIDNKPHIFLEYIEGGDLLECIRNGRLDVPQSLDFAIQFCDGMIYANNKDLGEGMRGIVHRDIKPANIMLTKDGVSKITDFGLVKALGSLTAETLIGTPEYMSPEQFKTMDVDTRSDIYSFGVVLYEMLTGRPPFYIGIKEERWNYCKRHHQEVLPKPPSQTDSSTPPALERAVLKCLEKRPVDRYQSFESLREELMEIYQELFGERPEIKKNIRTLTAGAWLNKGTSLHELGKYVDALEFFDKALELNPRIALAWLNKGGSLYRLGRHDEAIECCNRALNVDPELAGAWEGMGASLFELGRFEEALRCFDKAIEKDPLRCSAWWRKGAALATLDKLQDAVRCYDEATKINPRYADAWDFKGTALAGLDRWEEAKKCSEKATELNPRNASAWANRGYSSLRLGKFFEAMQCCDRGLEINPKLSSAWLSKGLALIGLGRREEGLRHIDKAIEIDPKFAEAWNAKGAVLAALGRHEETLRCLDKALEINPRRADVWGGKGASLFELGRFEEALECFNKALEINPRDGNARRMKELILHELERAWRDFVKDDMDF